MGLPSAAEPEQSQTQNRGTANPYRSLVPTQEYTPTDLTVSTFTLHPTYALSRSVHADFYTLNGRSMVVVEATDEHVLSVRNMQDTRPSITVIVAFRHVFPLFRHTACGYSPKIRRTGHGRNDAGLRPQGRRAVAKEHGALRPVRFSQWVKDRR